MQNIFTRRQIRLQAGDVTSLQVTRPLCLQVGSGRVWVTIEGGRTDYWLSGGQSLDLPGQGLVVIESVNIASQLHIGLCRRHWALRLTRALAALTRRWSRSRQVVRKVAAAPGSCSH